MFCDPALPRGRCPACRKLLLLAGDQPQSPQQCELWLRTSRKAIKNTHPSCPMSTTKQERVHKGHTTATGLNLQACLSRVLGNGPAPFWGGQSR